MEWLLALLAALAGAAAVAAAAGRAGRQRAAEKVEAARAEAHRLRRAAELDAAALVQEAETAAREEGLELRDAAEREASALVEKLARREERAAKRQVELDGEEVAVAARATALTERESAVQSRTDLSRNARQEAEALDAERVAALERLAGATALEIRAATVEGWVEQARADAAQRVRAVDQNPGDPEHGRLAKRILGIAIQRYQGHYLTERAVSNIAIPPEFSAQLATAEAPILTAITEVTGVKVEIQEGGERVRLDSADGVAREIARRAINRILKGAAPRGYERDPRKWLEQIASNLDREIVDLGKRAFGDLGLPKAHPEIMSLVGRLNYRTSYTQNQWKHAVEAAFLAGMMAAELDLDVKLARRATLLHDIGKSLSHELEGSHAVIGADYARRLGEDELVANAIGAHHGEEQPSSIYAFLVAASDAMSGARPGARREQTDSYSSRLEDLERIGASFRGVERAFAVQGGREVRVYVRQEHVDDRRAVELSGEIARRISSELVFPGQIKVTVIRQVEAVSVAN